MRTGRLVAYQLANDDRQPLSMGCRMISAWIQPCWDDVLLQTIDVRLVKI